jgi:hypothetical protein
MATTALLTAKVAVADSGGVGWSAVYSKYNGPRRLPWVTPALTDDSSVCSVSTFMRKCLLCKYRVIIKEIMVYDMLFLRSS